MSETLENNTCEDSKPEKNTGNLAKMLSFMYPKTPIPIVSAPVSKYSIEYNMEHPNRGIALIFNNKTFSPVTGMDPRQGTDADAARLVKTFIHLGFQRNCIIQCNDLTASKIRDKLQEVASMDHSQNDCIVISILSHGFNGGIYGFDKGLLIEDFWEPFMGSVCPTLAGKPKLFFIQACRGTKIDHGVLIKTDVPDGSIGGSVYKIPACADFYIAYSTISGYYSWRSKDQGSWFIQCLCEMLEKYGHTDDIASLLTLVNLSVATEYQSYNPAKTEMHEKKQIPCQMTMLTRKVFFRPKSNNAAVLVDDE